MRLSHNTCLLDLSVSLSPGGIVMTRNKPDDTYARCGSSVFYWSLELPRVTSSYNDEQPLSWWIHLHIDFERINSNEIKLGVIQYDRPMLPLESNQQTCKILSDVSANLRPHPIDKRPHTHTYKQTDSHWFPSLFNTFRAIPNPSSDLGQTQ